MPVALKQTKTKSTVSLEGAIDIATSSELKKALLEALAAGKKVSVCLGKATELDVTAVQLLWAAGREATALCLDFALDGQEAPEIRSALLDSGLDLHAICGNA